MQLYRLKGCEKLALSKNKYAFCRQLTSFCRNSSVANYEPIASGRGVQTSNGDLRKPGEVRRGESMRSVNLT